MSLRTAINAKCKDCIYDPLAKAGTWREQIAQCSAKDCPLWPVRTAPTSGPFANPPRDTHAVSAEWVQSPVGEAKSPNPLGASRDSGAQAEAP